ncbi:methyl-accepting chemotaxis protein [Citreimonas salinaria]|uniref:Methyl-accepting chemotaxis protein n=1 Tax=Citreimonas salinaria TaxID=321339 RepID=A0A1H3ITI1_9RHOB|nr:methyl-accepting chemotaxis protein [Citreimonas salinaria]SDY30458.1 Methyl-accepting chemotaxis protein [Citreimonas salinaria]
MSAQILKSRPRGRGWLSSIGARLTLILLALGGVSALLGVVASMVFARVSEDMSHLTRTELAALEHSGALVAATDSAKNAMIGAIAARDAEALEARAQAAGEAAVQLDAAVAGLADELRADLQADATKAGERLGALVAARDLQFENEARVAQGLDALRAAGASLSERMVEMADAAYFDLAMGGETTIEAVDATLSDLVEEQFVALQSLLGARAEINLLSGAILSAQLSTDDSTRSILDDLALASRGRLVELIAGLEANAYGAASAESIRQAADAFAEIRQARGFRTGAATSRILAVRRDADVLLASAIDDMIFGLMIAAEEASAENREAIQGLLDEEVSFINTLFEISGAVSRFQESALDVAVAQHPDDVRLVAPDLLRNAEALSAHKGFADGALDASLAELVRLADPEGGLPAFKKAALQADIAAAEAVQAASAAVLLISERAAELGVASRGEIATMATEIQTEIAGARDQVDILLFVQAGGVLLALLLTRLLVQRPLRRISETTERLASGDLAEVTGFDRASLEINRIARALSVFRDGLIEKDAMEASQNAERQARMAEQMAAVTLIGNGLERLSRGDLTQRIEEDMAEGYDKLRTDFNNAQDNLRDMLRELSDASSVILSGTGELSAASDDLSRRTESQAATLEESVAALDEVTSNVNAAAGHARDVETTIEAAKTEAEQSRSVVREAIDAMQAIKTSSDKISSIVSVIDDIAFQTNLLSLNAGVEAARAGEAGRGFAVVASEVRGLAQRSSESAMEIKALIGDSAQRVDHGVDLVGNAGDALMSMLERFSDVSTMVAGISQSSVDQATSLKEVNTAMTDLDVVTQENAAMVQRTTEATTGLNNEASRLSALAARFAVDATPGALGQPVRRQGSGLRGVAGPVRAA